MRVRITPSSAKGKVVVPPSKSYAHRYLITSMLASDKCTISNIALSSDILASIECIKALGKINTL